MLQKDEEKILTGNAWVGIAYQCGFVSLG